MSTDDERADAPAVPVPRTRAEVRAAREAQERADREAAAAAPDPTAAAPDPTTPEPATPEPTTPEPTAPEPTTPEPARISGGSTDVGPAADTAYVPPAAEPAGPAPADPAPADTAPAEPTPVDPAPRKPGPSRRFLLTLAAVLGVLVLVGTGLGVVSLLQGPRLSEVQVDPAQAIESSGSRVILTANQALDDIAAEQVTVEPAVPFTVDASGRGVGIRFTVPLDDSTKYTVRVAGVAGVGGGPSTDLTTSFTTPDSQIFLLRRDAAEADTIFRTDLSGEEAVPVFSADKINDFRATSNALVVAVETDDGSRLLVMDREGKNERELDLPGDGFVSAIQVSDRGGFVGYNYSDRELSDTEGRASVLVTQSLSGEDEPQVIEVSGEEASVFAWQFVPDSAAVLFIDFDGALSLLDRTGDSGVQSLGLAAAIQGISRGTYTAIVERLDGSIMELNLADGSEVPLEASDPDYGPATTITPFPGGTLRHVVARDDSGIPIGQAVIRVDDEGAATPLVEVGATDSILQACASPSGQYAAVVIAPDMAGNPYDGMLLPLPETVETHLIDMDSGEEIVPLTGFDASWCQTAPRF
ncbi:MULTISPECIES: hypothetical protein [unclassified Microbacterium]|uniref:hypothetical protein n=1 Tax=unclassified Microbacterium TaxID=2609290 RepID=UPI0020358297|nr:MULTISPECIES: hypothetical protein [unclassified Microbacterium]